MLYKFKPNYFLATMGKPIQFDAKGEFNTNKEWHIGVMDAIGATKVVIKKTT